MKKTKWTKEEEDILVQAIESYPHNIKKACRQAAIKINRTPTACELRWYNIIAPINNPTKKGVSFLTVGPKTIYKNRKNSRNSTIKPEKSTLWTKIKKFISLK